MEHMQIMLLEELMLIAVGFFTYFKNSCLLCEGSCFN